MRMYCMYVWIVSYYQDTFLSVQNIKFIKFLTYDYESPSGIMYHHDLEYMRKLDQKEVEPYHFHM